MTKIRSKEQKEGLKDLKKAKELGFFDGKLTLIKFLL